MELSCSGAFEKKGSGPRHEESLQAKGRLGRLGSGREPEGRAGRSYEEIHSYEFPEKDPASLQPHPKCQSLASSPGATILVFPSTRQGLPGGSVVKNLPVNARETGVQSLGQEDPLGEGMTTRCSTLAWKSQEQRSLVDYAP